MASRKGSLLEKDVERLLKLSGFNPELNRIYNGYEIDIFLRYKNFKIAFECKQYERSTLGIRNLIHQWDSKNKELNFEKIVLILIGCDVSNKDYQLAKKYGIIIWNEQNLTNLLDNAIDKKIKNKKTVLRELGIRTDEIKEVQTEVLAHGKNMYKVRYTFKGSKIQNIKIPCPYCEEEFDYEFDKNKEIDKEIKCPHCDTISSVIIDSRKTTWRCEFCKKKFGENKEEGENHEKICKARSKTKI